MIRLPVVSPQPAPHRNDTPHRLELILWLAMTVSVGLYFLVLQFFEPAAARDNPTLVTALMVVAAGMAMASFAVKQQISASAADSAKGKRAALIVALAMCEAAALFGVVVRFVTGSPRYWVFLALALAAMLLHYPRRED